MARGLTPQMVAALSASGLRPFIMTAFYFDGGTVRFWSGLGQLTYFGAVWHGSGDLLQISAVEETADIRAAGISITLSAFPQNMVSIALQEPYQGRTVEVYLGMFDESGAVIADPEVLFRGRMDIMEIREGADAATIVLTAESEIIRLRDTRGRRWTHEDQQIEFPGDRGFEYVADIQDMDIPWGRG